ncbi:hypothetical protein BGZ76_003383 [Entomortierella beljakovae]|nr:hypothetical protein BGZ76_003383 [Entomortierella beljakovae]
MDIRDPAELPPLLIDTISGLLKPHDLVQCCLVSKLWSIEFGDRLWKDIVILNEKAFQHFYSSDAIVHNAIIRHCNEIRSLTLRYYNWSLAILPLFSSACTKLNTIDIRSPSIPIIKHRPYKLPITTTAAATATATATATIAYDIAVPEDTTSPEFDLEEFTLELDILLTRNLSIHTVRFSGMLDSTPFVKCLIRADLRLSRVYLSTHDHLRPLAPAIFKRLLDCISDTVQDLQVNITLDEDLEEEDESIQPLENLQRIPLDTSPLRNLYIGGHIKNIDGYIWSKFLSRCHNLQRISIAKYAGTMFLEYHSLGWIAPIIRESMPHLTELEFITAHLLEQQFVSILDSCSGLTEIKLPFGGVFGRLAIEAAIKHAPTLERIFMEGCSQMRSRDVGFLLTSAPNLKSLTSMARGESQSTRCPRLSAISILAMDPWICGNLTVLKLTIMSIPRPDLRGDGKQGSMAAIQRGIDIERSVCSQLGSLVHLEELWLGREYTIYGPIVDDNEDEGGSMDNTQDEDSNYSEQEEWENEYDEEEGEGDIQTDEDYDEDAYYSDFDVYTPPTEGFQSDCLQLTLATGLELMENMKAMRILNIHSMAHHVRQAEVQWICEKWPKLTTIVGLFHCTPSPDSIFFSSVAWDPIEKYQTKEWLLENRPNIKFVLNK